MRFSWLLGVIVMFVTYSALAEQGCPPGQIPAQAGGNMASCGPIPDGYYQQAPGPRRSGKWITTWGAISMGSVDSTTIYGVPIGKRSRSEAEQDALIRCASQGATDCKVVFTYNQCTAIAEPHINGLPASGGIVKFISAETTVEAGDLALKRCEDSNKEIQAKCEVVYTNCTEPIFQEY
jgi:hypothetical protein